MTAEEVIVKFSADIDDYRRSLAKAEADTKKATASIGASSTKMGKAMSMGTMVAGTALGSFIGTLVAQLPSALIAAAKHTFEYAGELKKTAQILHVTTDELQAWDYAAKQVGLTTEQMEGGFKALNRTQILITKGSEKQVAAMKALGYSMEEMSIFAQKSGGEAMKELLTNISKIGIEAKQNAAMISLFGKSGMSLVPMLKQGEAGMAALIKRAHELGLVLDKDLVDNADKAAAKLAEMNAQLKAKISTIVAQNAESIVGLAMGLAQLTGAIIKFVGTNPKMVFGILAAALTPGGLVMKTLGAIGGMAAGSHLEKAMQDASTDMKVRNKALQDANANLARVSQLYGGGPAGKKGREQAIAEVNRQVALRRKAIDTNKAVAAGLATPELEPFDIPVKAEKGEKDRTAEIAQAYADALAEATQSIETMNAELSGAHEAMVQEEKDAIDVQRNANIGAIQLNEDYKQAQKDTLIALEQTNAERAKQLIDLREQRRLDEMALALTNQVLENTAGMLEIDLAQELVREEQAKIEKAILRAKSQQLLNALEAARVLPGADKDTIDQQINKVKQDLYGSMKALDEKYASPGQKALQELNKELANMDDILENMAIDKITDMQEALAGALTNVLGLKGGIGELVTEFMRLAIKMALIKPLMEAIFSPSTASPGNIFLKVVGAISGFAGGGGGATGGGGGFVGPRASGGPVSAGQSYMVGEQGREMFVPNQDGTIIPNHALGASEAAPIVRVSIVANDYFDARVQGISGLVSAQIVQAATPQIVEASQSKTFASLGRGKM